MSQLSSQQLFESAEYIRKYMENIGASVFPVVDYTPSTRDDGDDLIFLGQSSNLYSLFSRFEENEKVDAATKEAEAGKLGDVTLGVIQGGLLSVMDRAYRLRVSTAIRRRIHVAAVHAGHGHPAGIWGRGLTSYIGGVKQATGAS